MSCELSKMSVDPFRKLSILYADWEHLNARLRDYYNNLHKLERQIAEHGTIDIPLNLLNARDSTESEIAKLIAQINQIELSISEIKKTIIIEEKEKPSRGEVKALLSNFWQISDGDPLFCAVSTLKHKETLKYRRPMTGFGEIRGYASIIYSLARAYKANVTKDAMLYFSDAFPMNVQLESSLILLGGDDRNRVTAEMFDKFERVGWKLPFRFVYEEDRYGNETGTKYLICENEEEPFNPVMKDDRVIEDFGIVARLPNPFNPDHSKLFIFAGCHTFGTAASAKVPAARSILKRLEDICEYYPKGKFFVAVIHANVAGYYYSFIDRMGVFYPLNEETLKPIAQGIERDISFRGAPLDD